jgi:hypothetical protein
MALMEKELASETLHKRPAIEPRIATEFDTSRTGHGAERRRKDVELFDESLGRSLKREDTSPPRLGLQAPAEGVLGPDTRRR